MVKKVLLTALVLFSLSASAETIYLEYGFSAASNLANIYRVMAKELNAQQTKYDFIVEVRPGAGGAIAVNHTLQNPQNSLYGTSSTFFIRTNFDKSTGYSVDSFRPVFVQGQGSPLVLMSKKYKSLKDIKPSTDFTVSISGVGSISHIMASQLGTNYPNIRIINYPTLIDANRDILGQHVDTGWNWLGDVGDLIATGNVNSLGITGNKTHGKFNTLPGFENLTSTAAIVAPIGMSEAKAEELYKLFKEVNETDTIQSMYQRDYYSKTNLSWIETQVWYVKQVKFWKQQSEKVKPL